MSIFTNNMPRNLSPARKQAGLAVIETAIAMPLVVFMMLFVAELGNAFLQYNALTQGVRDGARFLASAPNGTGGVIILDADDIATTSQLVAYGTVGTGTPIVPGLMPGDVTVVNLGNGNFSLTVNYDYQPLLLGGLPLFYSGGSLGGAFTMRVGVVMRVVS
jgi:Flp pilus assembly protein TadG